VNEGAADALYGSDTVGRSIRDPQGFPVEVIGVLALRNDKNATGQRQPTIYFYNPNQMNSTTERIASARFQVSSSSKLEMAELDANAVSPNYFSLMGWPVIAGRIFPDDSVSRGCRVGVVNQEAADLYFNGRALGAAVIDDVGHRTEIIGVVRSVPLGTFQRPAEPAIYFPIVQDYLPRMTMILTTREVSGPSLVELRKRIESVPGRDPAPVIVTTLNNYLNQTALAPLHISTTIMSASAATALVLTVLGLFGATSDAARQRRRELAIRIALGAQRWHVICQVIREGGRLAGAGALVGTLASLLLSRTLARITPSGGSPTLWVWLAGPLALLGVVAIASVVPARRASMISPLRIMRDDH
jgi:hypothetical protein